MGTGDPHHDDGFDSKEADLAVSSYWVRSVDRSVERVSLDGYEEEIEFPDGRKTRRRIEHTTFERLHEHWETRYVRRDEWESLVQALEYHTGVEDFTGLERALAADREESGRPSIRQRTAAWIKETRDRLPAETAVTVSFIAIKTAIAIFLGLHIP